MAKTPSTMLPLGTTLPPFRLLDTSNGKQISYDPATERPVLVAFICNHCPFVIHIQEEWVKFTHEFQERISIFAISSNDISTHPADGPEQMKREALRWQYPFPYLFDETQAVAKSFRAACTPDFYLFDASHKLVYRGQFDESRPGSKVPVTGKDLRQACNDLLNGRPLSLDQRPSLGCNIKWKAGNEPDYFFR